MDYKQGVVVFVALVATISVVHQVEAQNMVVNPTFDGDLSGWTDATGEGTFVFDPLNYAGPAGSGSGLIEVTSTSPMYTSLAGQCVSGVSDVESYDWGARVFIPSGQGTTGSVYIQLVWYSTTDCSGTYLTYEPFTNVIPHTVTDVWTPTRLDDRTPPTGAQSARISLSVTKTAATAIPFRAHFDGVFFGLDPIPVELQSWTVE